jgi:hypothetical protein
MERAAQGFVPADSIAAVGALLIGRIAFTNPDALPKEAVTIQRHRTICDVMAAGLCDLGGHCDGVDKSCPASVLAPAGTVCANALGPCALPATCDGQDASCPAGSLQPAGTVCRPSDGPCEVAATCGGSSADCPPNGVADAGIVCRPATGVCDLAEVCDGKTTTCPPDSLEPPGTPCGPAPGVCQIAASCTGSAVNCPSPGLDTGDPCDGGVCMAGKCEPRMEAGAGPGDGGAEAGDEGGIRDAQAEGAGEAAADGAAGLADAGGDSADSGGVLEAGSTAPDEAGGSGGCSCRVGASRQSFPGALAGLVVLSARGAAALYAGLHTTTIDTGWLQSPSPFLVTGRYRK